MSASRNSDALRERSNNGLASGAMAPARAPLPSHAPVGAIESALTREQIHEQFPVVPNATPTTSREEANNAQTPNQRDATSASPRPSSGEKKRKTTYNTRKEETAQLREETLVLQTALHKSQSQLQHEAPSLVGVMAINAGLQDRVRQYDLAIASAQSIIASYGSQSRSSPIGGFIHLPRDPIVRQQTLTNLKMPRIQEATAYALTRSRFLDAAKFAKQVDCFETNAGDIVATHWEITPLPEARSVQHAYRELLYFTETQEMSMSEKLGILTIRESESDPIDGTQAVRMLSTHEGGVQSETNLAVFAHFFEESELLTQPHAILVSDFVDQDDLYPRQPETRIQKDVASLTMITDVPSPSLRGPPVVTMVRWAFVRVNHNTYTSRCELEEVAREGAAKWCDVMVKSVRERLVWHS